MWVLIGLFLHISKLSWWMSTITELLIPQQETGGLSSRLKVWFNQKSEQERTVVEYHHISFCSAHKCTNKQLFHRISFIFGPLTNQIYVCVVTLRLQSSNYTWNFLDWFVLKRNILTLNIVHGTVGKTIGFGTGTCELRNRDTMAWIYPEFTLKIETLKNE